ncbi:MAG: ATP-binding protein, partial [Proteobacteria bacterium]|nr:ATP-binding protein [Pseudomonadota bacterium]
MTMPLTYRSRLVETSLSGDLEAFPVVVLSGARQTGKSTLARESQPLGQRPYVTLDDFGVLEQAADDPHNLLQRFSTMTLDEVQREPRLLMALKALVDQDRPRKPGRFLLTGSANLLLMSAVSDSLAGRAAYRTLYPMTRREQLGKGSAGCWTKLLIEEVARWPELLAEEDVLPESWRELAYRGGFPVPALELQSASARTAWFEGYIRTYLERDLRDLSSVHSLPDFRRLMRAAAQRMGGLLNQTELGRDVGLPASTVQRHLGLLETSHLLFRL